METVIYVGYHPITAKFYADFYVQECINQGLKVEYWDISYLYFPKIERHNVLDFDGTRHIKSFSELKNLLSLANVKSTLFIINITYTFKVWRLFMLLSKYKCIIAYFGRGMYPSEEKNDSLKIVEVIFSFDYNRLLRGIKAKIAIWLKYNNLVKNYDMVFRAGYEGYKTTGAAYELDFKHSKIVDVNYFDHDKYLLARNEKAFLDENYCVFLDEYLPYHPDVEMLGIVTVNATTYYSELNKFFDEIEKKFGLAVVIAAHPKGVKYKAENPFNGRTVIFGKTCELVKDAKFVLTHHSTSVSYAILFNKPIVLLTSQAQKQLMYPHYSYTIYLGKYLSCDVVYFDNFDFNKDISLAVDADKYEDYRYKYLTSKKSENKQSALIFVDEVLAYRHQAN